MRLTNPQHLCACRLYIGLPACCLEHCVTATPPCLNLQALTLEPGNSKALFRRGRAKHNMGQTEGAEEDLKAALAK